MIDQPVTPDREALEAVIRTRIREHIQRVGISGWTTANAAAIAADACTEALDRARQQGREEAAQAVTDAANSEEHGVIAYWMHHCARLARGADRKADRSTAMSADLSEYEITVRGGRIVHTRCGDEVSSPDTVEEAVRDCTNHDEECSTR